jgi:arabinan endo-1,5-alpha-L-arabinosidase
MKRQNKWYILLSMGISVFTNACQSPAGKSEKPLMPVDITDDYSAITSLAHKNLWGAANVHDPSVIKTDSFYYAYSTDAYYIPHGSEFNPDSLATGHIQIRRSADLVNWDFVGWALKTVPLEAVTHVRSNTQGNGAEGIWAPYIVKYQNEYRLYYSVSSFGTNSSYIGMAVSNTPEGPWEDQGCVVKTTPASSMNAIDPSIATGEDGRMWMHYGSYFSGLYCMELNPETGLAFTPGDEGHLTATRSEKAEKIIEAPEIIYHPDQKKYYLFVSYDPLFTHYNLRVGRSDHPQGPFFDMFGNDMADTTNNYPIVTHSYMFEGHPGWSGNAHCAVINDNGRFFMFHQGRLAPDNLMMVMHVREIFWLPSGWPVVSPQRYAGIPQRNISTGDLVGDWEVIELTELPDNVKLWQGQIPFGGWTYSEKEFNVSTHWVFNANKKIEGHSTGSWEYANQLLKINDIDCVVFPGWDWENRCATILFAGILENGSSIWGKKVNLTNK